MVTKKIQEEWQVKRLGDILKVRHGKDQKKIIDRNGLYPILGTSGEIGRTNSYLYAKPSVLIGRKGTINHPQFMDTPFWSIDTLFFTELSQEVNPKFVFYLFCQINWLAIDESSGRPSLTATNIENIEVNIPTSLKEQEKISNIISDTDKFIKQLENLITKKKNIKTGTMQELLTGKRRLEGFSEEWKTKLLGKIGSITGAGIDKKINSNEIPVRLVNYLDVYKKKFIYSKHLKHKVTATPEQSFRCMVRTGDIFFTPTSEVRNDIGVSAVAMEDIPDAGYSYHVVRLRPFKKWDTKFGAYIFQTHFFLKQCETVCEGSGQRYVITLKRFRELVVKYPIDIQEQKAISQILSDMDKEIEGLERKKEKYKMIKNGMMQKLLTGEIRLK